MNRLDDMGLFPVAVYLGATGSVRVEELFFHWPHVRTACPLPAGMVCAVALLVLNLLPVVALH